MKLSSSPSILWLVGKSKEYYHFYCISPHLRLNCDWELIDESEINVLQSDWNELLRIEKSESERKRNEILEVEEEEEEETERDKINKILESLKIINDELFKG